VVNNAESYIAACCAGLGLIQVPLFDVQHLLERGDLVEVMAAYRLSAHDRLGALPEPASALSSARRFHRLVYHVDGAIPEGLSHPVPWGSLAFKVKRGEAVAISATVPSNFPCLSVYVDSNIHSVSTPLLAYRSRMATRPMANQRLSSFMKFLVPRKVLFGLFAFAAMGSASATPMKTSTPVFAPEATAVKPPVHAADNPWPTLPVWPASIRAAACP
jgi:hypothetical protein